MYVKQPVGLRRSKRTVRAPAHARTTTGWSWWPEAQSLTCVAAALPARRCLCTLVALINSRDLGSKTDIAVTQDSSLLSRAALL